jgi:hypothetical protein
VEGGVSIRGAHQRSLHFPLHLALFLNSTQSPGAWPAPRPYAPRSRGPGSGPLSAGARRRRRGPSPWRAGRHSPLRFTGPWARVGLSASPTSPLFCAACAWSRWARRADRRRLAATFAGGREGDVSRPPGPSPCRTVAMGSGGGTCPPLSLTRWAIRSTSSGAPRRRRGPSPRRAAREFWVVVCRVV